MRQWYGDDEEDDEDDEWEDDEDEEGGDGDGDWDELIPSAFHTQLNKINFSIGCFYFLFPLITSAQTNFSCKNFGQ